MEPSTALILMVGGGLILYYVWNLLKPPVIKTEDAVRRGTAESLQADSPFAVTPGQRSFQVPVVGESHYQAALEAICIGRTVEGVNKAIEAVLVLEDSNPYDPDAVRVDIAGMTVGYLSRENARQYRSLLIKQGHPRVVMKCMATIVGGWDRGGGDRGHFGVTLDIPAKIGS